EGAWPSVRGDERTGRVADTERDPRLVPGAHRASAAGLARPEGKAATLAVAAQLVRPQASICLRLERPDPRSDRTRHLGARPRVGTDLGLQHGRVRARTKPDSPFRPFLLTTPLREHLLVERKNPRFRGFS